MSPQAIEINDEGPRPGVHPGIRRLIERPGGPTHIEGPRRGETPSQRKQDLDWIQERLVLFLLLVGLYMYTYPFHLYKEG